VCADGRMRARKQVTYPLDTLRLRLAVDPAARSLRGAALALLREGSYAAFFRGLGASMLGAPAPSVTPRCVARRACMFALQVRLARGAWGVAWALASRVLAPSTAGHRLAGQRLAVWTGGAALCIRGLASACWPASWQPELLIARLALLPPAPPAVRGRPRWLRAAARRRAGIAPYMALELAVFDLIPRRHLPFARGFSAALLATTACYPLDTVRRAPARRPVRPCLHVSGRRTLGWCYVNRLSSMGLLITSPPVCVVHMSDVTRRAPVLECAPLNVLKHAHEHVMLQHRYPAHTWAEGSARARRRRQIQLQSGGGVAVPEMARRILTREGVPGFYRGFLPNALKNLPNKGARAPGQGPSAPVSTLRHRSSLNITTRRHHAPGRGCT